MLVDVVPTWKVRRRPGEKAEWRGEGIIGFEVRRRGRSLDNATKPYEARLYKTKGLFHAFIRVVGFMRAVVTV